MRWKCKNIKNSKISGGIMVNLGMKSDDKLIKHRMKSDGNGDKIWDEKWWYPVMMLEQFVVCINQWQDL